MSTLTTGAKEQATSRANASGAASSAGIDSNGTVAKTAVKKQISLSMDNRSQVRVAFTCPEPCSQTKVTYVSGSSSLSNTSQRVLSKGDTSTLQSQSSTSGTKPSTSLVPRRRSNSCSSGKEKVPIKSSAASQRRCALSNIVDAKRRALLKRCSAIHGLRLHQSILFV